jgi:hypothetical protein
MMIRQSHVVNLRKVKPLPTPKPMAGWLKSLVLVKPLEKVLEALALALSRLKVCTDSLQE